VATFRYRSKSKEVEKMTWISAINDCPKFDDDHYDEDQYYDQYDEWLEKVMVEPWVAALEDLIKWTRLWVGTEEQLIGELKMRAGKEVSASPDFPSSYEQLDEYIRTAIEGFQMKYLEVMHYRELTEEDLEDFDVPEWGPEAPIVVFQGDVAYPLDYWNTHVKLLEYWHPLPLAILRLAASRDFAKYVLPGQPRKRIYTTRELAKALRKHYPHYGTVPKGFADRARPEGVEDPLPNFKTWEEYSAMREPYDREEHIFFHKQMRKWAPILEEVARIKISSQKHSRFPGLPESKDTDRPAKTFWTIQAPRYADRDVFGKLVVLTWSDFGSTPGSVG
jgi:hypothetical protein